MAAPISSYDLLKPLSNPSKYSHEFETMNKVLNPFELFAFIIHDPEEHSAFDREMRRIFDRLDYLTGEKLLFFSLIDPPEEWLQHGREREYFKYLGEGKALVSPDPENRMASADKELTAFSLARIFNIPIDMLPCIVITHDFRSKQFNWVRTCNDHIETQLRTLGYKASRITDSSSYKLMEQDIRQEIDLCEGSGSESLESNLAQALIDVLSFIIDSDDPEVQQRVDNTMQGLLQALKSSKERIESVQNWQSSNNQLDRLSILYSDLGGLCEKIVAFLAHLNSNPQQDLANFIEIDTQHLEVDSCLILKTSHLVNDLLMNAPTRLLDYTVVVICLAKIFEREINLSVVHYIRQKLGIKLPCYFNKPQDRMVASFHHNGRTIDFNKSSRSRNRWAPPAIGESQIAYRQLKDDMVQWLSEPSIFLDYWEKIRRIRNRAAHTQVVGEQSVKEIKSIFNKLHDSDIFANLYNMKEIARNEGFA